MAVTCPKCEFVNEAGTGKPMEACPQCSVIYQRAALAAAQQKLQEATRSRVESSKPATTGPGFIERVGWYVCIVGLRYGLAMLIVTMATAESSPQQAAGAGLALASAAIPYCLARAIQLVARR